LISDRANDTYRPVRGGTRIARYRSVVGHGLLIAVPRSLPLMARGCWVRERGEQSTVLATLP
jgi:hypothetical protein